MKLFCIWTSGSGIVKIFQEMLFKDISIFSSASNFCAILVESNTRNIHVKLSKFGSVVQDMPFKDISIFRWVW